MKIEYGIIAISKKLTNNCVDILHFCGYEKKPRLIDFNILQQELDTDSEHELVGKKDTYILIEAPKDVVEIYSKGIE